MDERSGLFQQGVGKMTVLPLIWPQEKQVEDLGPAGLLEKETLVENAIESQMLPALAGLKFACSGKLSAPAVPLN